ncbi:MAG: hypothetical protein OEL53_08175 [Rhodospirillales bacterium]|nr:hypothetical protein [Rhodospirillales bacterium]
MEKTSVAGLCAAVIGISASGALAQEAPVPFKAPAEGTVLEYVRSSGKERTVTVDKVEGPVMILNGGATRYISFGPGLDKNGSITDEEIQKIAAIFPLEVGKKVTSGHTYHGRSIQGTTDTLEVLSAGEITVPAGTFKTWVIKTSMYNAFWNGRSTCWYAPQIGYCAKTSFEDNNGDRWTQELKSVKAP